MNTSDSSTKTTQQKILKLLLGHRKLYRYLIRVVWIGFVVIIVGLPLYIVAVKHNFLGLFGDMPSLESIENPQNDLSSELISDDGVLIGRYWRHNDNRSQVGFDELSNDLVNTLLISEDVRFYDHSGMDFIATLRVLWGLITLHFEGGGSTITQQLAKNLYTQNSELDLDGKLVTWLPNRYLRRLIEKTKEWIISVYLESNFTKKEIIALYLNTTEFGSNAYGIKVASETYFDKPVDSLNIQESAMLVGMLQAPSAYSPVYHPERSLEKRNQVLSKLYKYGYIGTEEEYDSIRALPIDLHYQVQNQNEGLATYFRSEIQNDFLIPWCREHHIDLWHSGLKIYTTIDTRMQRYAETAVEESMKAQQQEFNEHWKGANPWIDDDGKEIPDFLQNKIKKTETYHNLVSRYGEGSDSIRIMLNLKKPMTVFSWNGERDTLFSSMDSLNYYERFLQAGFVAVDANTGAVKAWVGGINHKYFKYDHVKQGKRQPGSTFKPFVYGTAMEQGYNPFQQFADVAPSFQLPGGKVWYPTNDNNTRGTGEMYTLRRAMAASINSITAQLLQQVGVNNVVSFAHRVGIKSHLDAVPSLCLGVSDVSLYEIAGAYATFVNGGICTDPYYITKIEDRNGNVLENFVPKTKQAISEQTAYKMVYMLRGGVEDEHGTSAGLPHELKDNNEIGGKTGTTNNASDGWYVGVTKDLVGAAWVGGDERCIHYRDWVIGQGARTALPIWSNFLLQVYADKSLDYRKGPFRRPSSLDITLDPTEYEQADTTNIQESWNPNDFK